MLLHCFMEAPFYSDAHVEGKSRGRVEILLALFSPLHAAKSHTDPREQVPERAATVVCAVCARQHLLWVQICLHRFDSRFYFSFWETLTVKSIGLSSQDGDGEWLKKKNRVDAERKQRFLFTFFSPHVVLSSAIAQTLKVAWEDSTVRHKYFW